MKDVKVFLLLMLALCLCIFILDWFKTADSFAEYRSTYIRFQTLFLIIAGIFIMKITLQKPAFYFFLFFYGSMWLVYFLLKFIVIQQGSEATNTNWHTHPVMASYIKFTQLLTPFPFLFFWLLNRMYI